LSQSASIQPLICVVDEANSAAAQGRCDPGPTFNFSATSIQFVPALVHKKTKAHARINNNDKSDQPSQGAKQQTGVISQTILFQSTVRSRLEEIVPLDLQMRLENFPLQCAASLVKDPQKRCSSKAKAPKDWDPNYVRSLTQCIENANWAEGIRKIIQTVFCGTHQNSANRRLDKLQWSAASVSYLANDELLCSSNAEDTTSNYQPHDAATPKEKRDRRTRGVPPTETRPFTAQATIRTRIARSSTRPVLHLTRSYSLEFFPYQSKKWESKPVQDALREIITRPLSSKDLEDGFIYVFWDVKHFGIVKIGRTNDLQRRLKEWDRRCKRKHVYHTTLPMIPHVARIERLIHMELKQYRRSRRCLSCEKSHNEWFEVTEKHTVNVFQKWQQWIDQKPYELDAELNQWTLRQGMLASIPQLCEPVLVPAIAESKQKRRPRKSSRLSNQQKRDDGSQGKMAQ